MAKLLEGLRVVELGTHVAVPKAARLMSEWGADVIKVESPAGEAYRSSVPALWQLPMEENNNPIFENENSGKQSICLDLKNPEGQVALHKLLETADVFLTNTRPKPLTKLGLDYQSLKAQYPKLIYAHFSGFGDEGPEKDRPGFDVTAYWARSGVLTEWALADGVPSKPTPGFGDGTVASLLLAAILAALLHREKSGEGECINASLLGAALWYNSTGVVQGQPQYGKIFPKPRLPDRPFNPLYKTKEGDWILLSVPDWNQKYPGILRLLGLSDYIEDPRFATAALAREHSAKIVPLLDEAFGKIDTATLLKGLTEMDVNHSKLANSAELYQDEQAWANGYLYEHTLECGEKVVLPRPPIKFAGMPDEPGRRAPHLGEHSAALLTQLGYSAEALAQATACGGVVQYQKK